MSCFVSLVRETKQTFCRSKEVETGQAKKDFGAKSATESLRCINETFNRELKANAKFDSVRATADAIRVAVDVEEVMKDFNNNWDINEKVDEGLVLFKNFPPDTRRTPRSLS